MDDATSFVQEALDAAAAYDGLSTVILPAGQTYRVKKSLSLHYASNVRITGTGTLQTEGPYGLILSQADDDHPAQDIAPATAGTFTVSTAAPASGLTAGDYVLIYTGQTTAAGKPPQYPIGAPDSEINRVASVAGSTVTLEWPLTKDYVQEFFEPGETLGTGTTSPDFTGDPAALALRKIDPARNITIDSIAIDHRGAQSWLAGHLLVDLTLDGITGTTASHFQSMSGWTGEMRNCNIHTTLMHGHVFSVAYGARDASCRDCTFTTDKLAYVHVHEGAADITIENVSITNGTGQVATKWLSIIGLLGRGYNVNLTNVDVTNASEGEGGTCLRVAAGISGAATGCTFVGGVIEGGYVNGSAEFTVTP